MLYVDCDQIGLLTVRQPGSADIGHDQDIGLRFDARGLHFFDSDGEAIGR